MNQRIWIASSLCFILAGQALAQLPQPGRPQGRPQGRRGFGGPGGPPGFNLMTALDTNRDGKISKEEIKNAQAALTKLDKNKDGKLSSAEIGWPPNFGGTTGNRTRSGGFRRGGFGGQSGPPVRPTAEQTDSPRPTNRRPQTGQPRRSTGRTFFTLEQLKRVDRNGDGKITKDEVPRGLQDLIFGRLDANKDGTIDAKELKKAGTPRKEKK